MRPRLPYCFVMALMMTGLVAPAQAQDGRRTKIVLNEIATREVEQDMLAAVLAVRAESGSGRDSQALADTAMAAALEKVTSSSGITHLSRSGYRIFQKRNAKGGAGAWVAERDLKIKSREIVTLLQLVGRLQADGLILESLAYELSAEGRRATESELAAESIEALRARSQKFADGLGMRVDSIESLRVAGTRTPGQAPIQHEAPAPPPEAKSGLLPIALPDHEVVGVAVDLEVTLTGP